MNTFSSIDVVEMEKGNAAEKVSYINTSKSVDDLLDTDGTLMYIDMKMREKI